MKPEHQWQTRLHMAHRDAEGAGPGFEEDARAEGFTLRFADGRTGRADLGLTLQRVDDVAASDPDLEHAVRCWLAARGARELNLQGPDGTLASGPFEVRSLGDAPAEPATRLIPLCPSNAELVHALGCFDRVVACEDSSDYPPAVSDLPRLGPDLGPDLDRVAELEPDLVVSSLSVPGMERIVTGLRARGIPQAVLAPRRIADVLHEARWLGQLLGVAEAGAQVAQQMEREMQQLRQARQGPSIPVYLEWWPKPMFTPGADCYSNELIELAGGHNVFAARAGSSVQIEAADLLEAAPDVCFVSWCGVALDKLDPQRLVGRAGLQTLRAAQSGHVYPLDEAYSGRPGPRMLEAARVMARGIARARSMPLTPR